MTRIDILQSKPIFIIIISDGWIKKPGRCFGMVPCNKSPSNVCQSHNESEKFKDLKEKCLRDNNCVAVSCDVNENNDQMCNRYMFSSSCNSSTIQERNGWIYNIVNSGKNYNGK